MDIPERADVVDGLLPRGDAVLLSAREKSGKGLLMMAVSRCIAIGQTFLGRAVQQGPTLYLALEEGQRTIRDRYRAVAGDRPDLPMHVSFLDGSEDQTFRLDDRASITGLRDTIAELQPVLVVLDVLREAHDGRENESDDMAMLLRPIRQLAHEMNVCIVVTHHASKNGGFRGSTSIAAAFDDVIEFTRDDVSSDLNIRGSLSGRGRDLPKFSMHIEFDPDTFMWRAIHGAPAVSQPTNTREKIISLLNATDDWLTADEIADRISDASKKSVQNALGGMAKEVYRQFLIKGSGKRGDPHRYHGTQKRTTTSPNDSGMSLGSNGQHEQKACVECGVATSGGGLYCPLHGGNVRTEEFATGILAWDELWSEETASS